jgi:heptaprenyl diphosphate synthase
MASNAAASVSRRDPEASAASELLASIAPQLQEFERRLEAAVSGDLGPMAEAMDHIVRAGGKRIRPALVILAALLGDPDEEHMYNLAMGVEFIHTATLVHDDLIDNAATRRGITTIHESMGAPPAIIIGDYYFAKGANLLSSIGEPSIDSAISSTVMTICAGELLQMTSKCDYDQSLDDYLQKIERKTATLLSSACFCGAVVARLEPEQREALQRYGRNLGMAFQIADDVLDYVATAEQLGKPVANDLRQGTVTLPFMLALQDPATAAALREIISQDTLGDADYSAIVELVRRSDAIAGAEATAREFATEARAELESLRPSPARETLASACDYVVARRL